MEIKTIFNEYLSFCNIYRKQGTYNAYKKSYIFLIKIFNELDIFHDYEIDIDNYHKLIQYIKANRKKKNSKINSLITDMMTAFRYSGAKILFKPFKLIDDTTHYKSLNDEEISLLLSLLKTYDLKKSNYLPWVTSILLMLDTGVRKNELLNIKTENVDLSEQLIYLDVTKNKKRVVRFGSLSFSLLKKLYNNNHDYLIWNVLKNEPMTKCSLERFLQKINRNLEFDSGNVHPHRLRKTFATRMLKAGCPVTTIQKLLGHSDIRMTMIYLDIDQEIIEKDYRLFYPY